MDQILLLPLFPQFSGPTTGSILALFFEILSDWRWTPDVITRSCYYNHPAYLQGLSRHIRSYWQKHGDPDHILFSFHGIPQSYVDQGDPYESHCIQSAEGLAVSLGISDSDWSISYQSRFGPQTWIQPYTEDQLMELSGRGFNRLDVTCPGFAVDCLETIDEIGREGKRLYREYGGTEYRYIPAMNATDLHVEALIKILPNP
jgi:ferrochelatase